MKKMKNLNRSQKTALKMVGVVVVMGALAWASVPFYDWFCRVTGFGGVTREADRGSDVVLDRTIRVRFDASRERGMPWEFRPLQNVVEIRIGETGLAFYEAYNPTDRPIAGQASYNVAPFSAGYYFEKIECFCFSEQILQPGERVTMPVTFFVSPDIVNDREARYVPEITLSYTFHVMDMPEEEIAEAGAAPALPANMPANAAADRLAAPANTNDN